MDKRFAGPSSENAASSAKKTKFGIKDLKKVKVVINRKLPPAKKDQVLRHDVVNQDDVKIIRFPDEGKRPIFDREDIVVNKEDDEYEKAQSSKHQSEFETNNETSRHSRRSEEFSNARRSYSREASYHGRDHRSSSSDRDRDRIRSWRCRSNSNSRRRYSPSRAGISRRSRSHERRRYRRSRSKSRRRSKSVDRSRRRRSRSPRYRRSPPRRRSRDRNHDLVQSSIDYAGAIGFLPNFMPPHELYLPNHPRGPIPPSVRFPPGMIPNWDIYRPQMYGMRPFVPPYRPHMMPPRLLRPRPTSGNQLDQSRK